MKKKSFVLLVAVVSMIMIAGCGNKKSKDPFAGKIWEGFNFIKSTLEFGTDYSVVVNLGVYEDEKGVYSFDKKEGIMVITLENHDPLNFTYDSSKNVLQLNDEGWTIDYKVGK